MVVFVREEMLVERAELNMEFFFVFVGEVIQGLLGRVWVYYIYMLGFESFKFRLFQGC